MDLKRLYLALDADQRARFCATAGTTDKYVRIHLVHARRVPRRDLLDRLLAACQLFEPQTTREELISFFYDVPTRPADPQPSTQLQGAA